MAAERPAAHVQLPAVLGDDGFLCRGHPWVEPTMIPDAVQYRGSNRSEVAAFMGDDYGFEAPCVLVPHRDGVLRAHVGAWIVRLSDGSYELREHEAVARG